MKAVFLDIATVDSGDLDLSPLENCVQSIQFLENTEPGNVFRAIGDAEIVITNKVALDRQILQSAGQLKLVCVAATGTNNIDVKAATELNIPVSNVRAYATPSVAQHTFALMLMLATKIPQYHQEVLSGNWSTSKFFCLLDFPIFELAGKRLGIIGYGELGRAVAKIAETFHMEVVVAQGHGTDGRRLSLEELLQTSDVVTLHCPLTDETRNMIGPKELALMRPSALLINTARGGIVDEEALINALKDGKLGGAGFDVLSQEPPPPDHIMLADDIPNLIVTPHTAWASLEARQRCVNEIAANIQAYQQGTPRNLVTTA